MAQREIEVIMLRQLASYLAMPIFIVDPRGSLDFYNEAVEIILGKRFEETGEMSAEEWSTAFQPTDE
jgi:PAS domain-containing protein